MIKLDWTGTGQPKLFFSKDNKLKPTWNQFNSPNLLLEIGWHVLKVSNTARDTAGFGAISVFLPVHKILEFEELKRNLAGINYLNGNSTSWVKLNTNNPIPNLSSCAWNNSDTMLFFGGKIIESLAGQNITDENAEYAYNEVKKVVNIDTIVSEITDKVGTNVASAISPHLVILTTLPSYCSAYFSGDTNFVNSLYSKNDNPILVKQERPFYIFVEPNNATLFAFIKPCAYPSPNNKNYINDISFNDSVVLRPYTNTGFLEQELTLVSGITSKAYIQRETKVPQEVDSDISFRKPIQLSANIRETERGICTLGKFKELLKEIR